MLINCENGEIYIEKEIGSILAEYLSLFYEQVLIYT